MKILKILLFILSIVSWVLLGSLFEHIGIKEPAFYGFYGAFFGLLLFVALYEGR